MTQVNAPEDLTARRLLDALDANQFVLYCQPILRLRPGHPDSRYLEILVRFLEEEEKLLPPGTFLPVLQEAGLMPLLDRWVIREALKWMSAGRADSPERPFPSCSVNLSPTTMRDRRIAAFVKHQLAEWRVPPESLSFELSMSQIRQDRDAFIRLAAGLQPLKCPLTVSGFGVSATTLPALRRLGVRVIKIDGALIRALARKSAALDKLKSITDACIGLGLLSIAEMVEEQETIAILRDAGVDYAQGFGVGLPIPLSQLS